MSELLKVIEQLATDAQIITSTEIESLVKASNISEELKSELLKGNIEALKEELNAREKIFCGIVPAEDDEPSEEDSDNAETESKLIANL